MQNSTIEIIAIVIGFLFTFFIPGIALVDLFMPDLESEEKLPLYLVLSILFSTYSTYFISLAYGFGKSSIVLSFFVSSLLFVVAVFVRKADFGFKRTKSLIPILALAVFCFVLYLVALFPGIFSFYKGYIVMSAENWQDTAMHMGIIESIKNGNFPPQAPYFSGHPLSYYYFSDLHTAIVATLTDRYFPRILVYDNPFFILTFVLALYGLTFALTKSKLTSLFASILGAFYGNFMFVNFMKDMTTGNRNDLLTKATSLISAKGYVTEYAKLMDVSPMSDYFLQNRPMMMGLPAYTVGLMLAYLGFTKKKLMYLLIAGIIASLSFKFQMFSALVSGGAFGLMALFFIRRYSFKEWLKSSFVLFVPFIFMIVSVLTSKVEEKSLFTIAKESFVWVPFFKAHGVPWVIQYAFANFGVQIVLFITAIGVMLFGKKDIERRGLAFLSVLFLILFLIPFTFRFTIFHGDMYKFWYLSIPPVSVLGGVALAWVWKRPLVRPLSLLLLIVASATSILGLSWSYLNKNQGYSIPEYNAGLWIRENTPTKSVFLTMPTVHDPATDMGGRLRVLSYINWPHSHGFNSGEDNVFSRLADVTRAYKFPSDTAQLTQIARKYKVSYIYYGNEERNAYPSSGAILDESPLLLTVYDQNNIKIYKFK